MRTIMTTLFLLFICTASNVYADETCQYVYHDHYKNNYRIRHKHKVCKSLAEHYKNDPFRTMKLYVPEIYIEEDVSPEEDTDTKKK